MRTQSTREQLDKAAFIEEWCDISFEGDLSSYDEVQDFIDENYERALDKASDASLTLEDLKS